MKNSIDNLQPEAVVPRQCNEETCATCFENRGCIYEQLGATIRTMEDLNPESEIDAVSTINRRA